MNPMSQFMKGVFKMPFHWQMWLLWLIAINGVVPIFFINRIEAIIVLVIFLLNGLLMSSMTARMGFTRLLGLGHALWIPMLLFLWMRLDFIPLQNFFGFWIRSLFIFNGISLIIDAVDVIRYLCGNRKPTIESLNDQL